MEIELRKISHSPRLSRETEAFAADLYINKIHAGYVENDGHGGPTGYYAKDERGKQLIVKAEEFCKALPPIKYERRDGMEPFSIDMNLEHHIDNLLADHLQAKELARFSRKMEKDMEKNIVYGVAGESYRAVGFKLTITEVLKHPKGEEAIKKAISESVLPKIEDGKVLNVNIPRQLLLDAGLSENQVVSQMPAQKDVAIENTQGQKGPKR